MIGSVMDVEDSAACWDLVRDNRVDVVEIKSSLSFRFGIRSFFFLCLFSLDIPSAEK